MLELLAVSLQ